MKALEHAKRSREKIQEALATIGRINVSHVPTREAVRGQRELATALARLVTKNKGATAEQVSDLAALADSVACALEGGIIR